MNKLIRITTVPISLRKLIKGQMRFMSSHYEVIAVSTGGNLLDEVELEESVRVKAIEMTREITLFKDLAALWKMYRLFRNEKPVIVHSHTPKAGIISMLAARLARVPIRLHTVAGLPLLEATGLKRKLLNRVEKFTYACATHVYPNSHGLKKIILENRFTQAKKLKVIANGSSNGIDTAHFNPALFSATQKEKLRASLNIHPDDFVFIFVGRLVKDKGINELVAAFRRIRYELRVTGCEFKVQGSEYDVATFPTLQVSTSPTPPLSSSPSLPVSPVSKSPCLLLLGPFEPELDPLSLETMSEIDNNPSIIHVGYQDDVRPYLAIADALVFPSYREGFPNVVMQAGAMGLPSIVTDINGCNEIIVEGKNGTIIPPKDKETLLKAMQYFLTDVEKVKSMALSARQMIESRYEQKVVWEALLEVYKRLELAHSASQSKNTV